ncbi:hypothetical protein JMJ94_05625 [Rhodovulum visakhapatnamense]|nr:hypothetical protein [Rhodovulum visakhapatnamense]
MVALGPGGHPARPAKGGGSARNTAPGTISTVSAPAVQQRDIGKERVERRGRRRTVPPMHRRDHAPNCLGQGVGIVFGLEDQRDPGQFSAGSVSAPVGHRLENRARRQGPEGLGPVAPRKCQARQQVA